MRLQDLTGQKFGHLMVLSRAENGKDGGTRYLCIDPGHGGGDPGAVNGSRKEKDDVLRLAQ